MAANPPTTRTRAASAPGPRRALSPSPSLPAAGAARLPDPTPSLLHLLCVPGAFLLWGEGLLPVTEWSGHLPDADRAQAEEDTPSAAAPRSTLLRPVGGFRVRLNGPPGTYDRGLALAPPPQGPSRSTEEPAAGHPADLLRAPTHPRAIPVPWLRRWLRQGRGPSGGVPPQAANLPLPPSTTGLRALDLPLPLPTAAGDPLPSPGLGGDPDARGTLAWWRVPALLVPLADAACWLQPYWPGAAALRLAPEWASWWELAEIAQTRLATRQVTPALRVQGHSGEVVPMWRSITSATERDHLRHLGRRLPPATFALWPGDASGALLAILWDLVDFGARQRLAADAAQPLAQQAQCVGARGLVPAWVAALTAPLPQAMDVGASLAAETMAWLADPLGADPDPLLVLRLDPPSPPQRLPVGDASALPGVVPASADQAALPATPADEANTRWPLRVFLRPAHDPGGLVPADRVWALESTEEALSECGTVRARLWLESRLRSLSRLVPGLSVLVRQREMTLWLDHEQAWRLLSITLPKLQAAGCEVLVPALWTQRPRARLHILSPLNAGNGVCTGESLVRFSWEVAIGDRSVSAAEFEQLVARRLPFCHLDGQWVALAPEPARALAAQWRQSGTSGEVGVGQALLMAARAEAEADSQPDPWHNDGFSGVEASSALLALRERMADLSLEMPEPEGFCGTLRPYQRRGLAWMAGRAEMGLGAVLADDMGLGKTIQVLALCALRSTAPALGPTLVVCPTSVVSNWRAEAERFAPRLRVTVHQGAGRLKGEALQAACLRSDLVLTSYALLPRDIAMLSEIAWDGVILDEAQAVKNASTKQAQAARRLRARYRLALTGTPLENGLDDLWAIFSFVAPGYLGSAEAFRHTLAVPIAQGRDAQAATTLRRLITPFVLRRTKDEPGVAEELPPRIETMEWCHLTAEQAALYEAVARDLVRKIAQTKGMQRRAAILLAILRLKQVCNHPAHYTGDARPLVGRSGKLARLETLLEEVSGEGQSALVFTQYATFARRLADHLGHTLHGCRVLCMDGATPAHERAALVSRFQEGAAGTAHPPGGAGREPCVFVLTVKTGGTGLNLTAARHVFHYDRWWNPAVERQATDRTHRIGQRHTVHVHKFVSIGTLEERIDALIAQKRDLFEMVLDNAGEGWLTELGDDDLRQILTLRRTTLET